jgi:hypothetical protein
MHVSARKGEQDALYLVGIWRHLSSSGCIDEGRPTLSPGPVKRCFLVYFFARKALHPIGHAETNLDKPLVMPRVQAWAGHKPTLFYSVSLVLILMVPDPLATVDTGGLQCLLQHSAASKRWKYFISIYFK